MSVSGKSGSGKTTLLNLIGGVDRPTSGTIYIDGINIFSLSDKELSDFRNKKIGFVFQSFMLEPSLTAIENVELPLLIRKKAKKQRTIMAAEILEKVGLKERLHHKPNELSGGEKQRVAIARALVTSPSILLADEPTGNLDEKTGNDIITLMQTLTTNCTFILVTHDESQANLAPLRIVMRDGRIVSENISREGQSD